MPCVWVAGVFLRKCDGFIVFKIVLAEKLLFSHSGRSTRLEIQ